ncbi:hypothetical protein ACLN7K_003950 [Escherichia coli]
MVRSIGACGVILYGYFSGAKYFSGEPLAAHTIDHRLTMVDLFCCTGASAGQVPAAGSEVLSRVNASGREVLTRVLVAGK